MSEKDGEEDLGVLGDDSAEGQDKEPNTADDKDKGDERSFVPEAYRDDVVFKKFKTAEDVFKSYKSLEERIGGGTESLVAVPDAAAPKDQWLKVYDKMGRPESPDKYEFSGDHKFSDDFVKNFSTAAHGSGLTNTQVKEITSWYGDMAKKERETAKDSYGSRVKSGIDSLKKEWGEDYEKNRIVMNHGLNNIGADIKSVLQKTGALSYPEVGKMLHKIGELTGEGNMLFADGGKASGDGAPVGIEDAKTQITELRGDKDFMKKYYSGEKASKQKMDKLYAAAHPKPKN